jgi:hypothetical protein
MSTAGSIVTLKAFPPTTWWRWVEGICPGLTSLSRIRLEAPVIWKGSHQSFTSEHVATYGSSLSTTSCEQEKRSVAAAMAPGASAPAAMRSGKPQCMLDTVISTTNGLTSGSPSWTEFSSRFSLGKVTTEFTPRDRTTCVGGEQGESENFITGTGRKRPVALNGQASWALVSTAGNRTSLLSHVAFQNIFWKSTEACKIKLGSLRLQAN